MFRTPDGKEMAIFGDDLARGGSDAGNGAPVQMMQLETWHLR